MIYFKRISSKWNLHKYRKESENNLINLRLFLEQYVYWKNIHINECENTNSKVCDELKYDEYNDLLNYIRTNIFNKNKSLQERYDHLKRKT